MATAATNWIGAVLSDGRYRVTRVLGEGGMGIAYLGWDTRLETEIVLKVPHRHLLSSPEVVERFSREIKSLVTLSHPHVVRVTDVAEHEGVPYSVMQYLSGGSLDDRLKQLPADASLSQRCDLLVTWLEAIATALDFVHKNDCVHRDVKPGNILFDKHGNAYLADFGVAKTLADQQNAKQATALTGAGMVLGTPDYMAPELITGHRFDGRVDQYALAFTAFEVLAGRLPFSAGTPTAMLVAQATQRPAQLNELIPKVPADISAAIARGMAKNPAERHASCHAMALAVVSAIRAASRAELEATPVNVQSMSESNRLACPSCKVVFRVPPELRGKRVPCSKCGVPLWVSSDLKHLELAKSMAGETSSFAVQPQNSMTSTASMPIPKIPSGEAPVRPLPRRPPPMPTVALPALRHEVSRVPESKGVSPLVWAAIGAGSGLAVLAVIYLGILAGSSETSSDDRPSDEQVASAEPSEPSPPRPLPKSPPSPEPAPPVVKPQPAETNPPVTSPVAPKPTSPPSTTTPPANPTPPTKPPPFNPPAPPVPPTPSPSTALVTTSVPISPPSAGPLADLPKTFTLPPHAAGEKSSPVSLGKLELKADETFKLQLLTEIDGVKARRAPSAGAAALGIAVKKEYRLEMSAATGKQRWTVVAKVVNHGNGKPDPDQVVGEFFVDSGKLQFQWDDKIEEAVADQLRNTVLKSQVGTFELATALRNAIQQPPLKIDLTQKITNVKFPEAIGLPPEEAIWIEILSTVGFPSEVKFDPTEKRAQGRKLKLILSPSKPEVRLEVDVNRSSSGATLLVEPIYEVLDGRKEEFTNERLEKYGPIDNVIRDKENDLSTLESRLDSLQGELAALPVPKDLNQQRVVAAQANLIRSKITSAKTGRSNTHSMLIQFRAIRDALPTLQQMATVHQRGEMSYRIFYIVGGHEVDVVRAEAKSR
jgi:serine/threonine protein kinase